MPKYLVEINYTAEGIKGVLDKGGSAREEAGREAVESAGGKLEALYFAFGDTDVYAICDMPNHAAAASVAMTVSATGLLSAKTTVLLTPAEIDAAGQQSVKYRPPGR
jgi:uncharacterized protein with GYD domain